MSRRSRKPERRLVVAAVVQRDDGRFLLSRRRPAAHLGGLWEFPGGAVEEGEAPAEALRRELREELGVDAQIGTPVTFAFHRDAERDVVLLFYAAAITAGEPTGLEGQEVGWFGAAELDGLPTPPADAELIARLAGMRARDTRHEGREDETR
jgi:8-oxo-dGTP diphosphatase